jgi:small subunit ribosomal protein S20
MLKTGPVSSFPRRSAVATATQKSKSKRTKSGLKRQRQSQKRHELNKSVKSMLRTLAKKVEQAVAAKSADAAKEALRKAMQAFDKAASAGVVHKSTASRKISRLSAKVSSVSAA